MSTQLASAKSIAAQAKFRQRLDELGATLLDEEWLGTKVLRRVRCGAGHVTAVLPNNMIMGRSTCLGCSVIARRHPPEAQRAKAAFVAYLDSIGAVLLDTEWRGVGEPHAVRCAAGHDCLPRPNNVMRGDGICWKCWLTERERRARVAAETAFRAALETAGATLLTGWLGDRERHRAICAEGHECQPIPRSMRQGFGFCRRCAYDEYVHPESAAAEAAFRARLAELGAVLLEPGWLGAETPHRIRCEAGHETSPRPGNVQRGSGICLPCSYVRDHPDQDVLYVVADEAAGRVKFGITSRAARRLYEHRIAGYATVIRCLSGLATGVAPSAEQDIIGALKLAGEKPVKGREYYDICNLALILDIVDNYPGVRMDSARENAPGSPPPVLVPEVLPLHWGQLSA